MRTCRLEPAAFVSVDDNIQILKNHADVVTGFLLPDGRVVKYWVVLELEENDSYRDLNWDEAKGLGISIDDHDEPYGVEVRSDGSYDLTDEAT